MRTIRSLVAIALTSSLAAAAGCSGGSSSSSPPPPPPGPGPLAVTGVIPVSGPDTGGTAIVVTGTGFVTGTTVTVGGGLCTSIVVISGCNHRGRV